MGRLLWRWSTVLWLVLWLLLSPTAQAGPLAERLGHFPDWSSLPTVRAQGDLTYPAWFHGTWQVTTTLVDLVAPLAPALITPGFEGNRSLLDQSMLFQARFVPMANQLVADRAFNTLSLAKAYLGERAVQTVKTDPRNPNRLVTLLRGNRQLVSIVTERATEALAPQRYITTEVFEQVFRGGGSVRFNRVETTTDYTRTAEAKAFDADQVTAVYLSPQDPDYFKATNRPVALYRYHLHFEPQASSPPV